MNPIVLAITGASGALYGKRLLQSLVEKGHPVELVVSAPGRRVAREELDFEYSAGSLAEWLGRDASRVVLHPVEDVGASISSGSYPVLGMVIAPCSMGTAGRVAAGLSQSLIERAADVQLKERRPLVLVVRETPLSTLHLQNLTRLSRAGATVLPASPGFYQRPETVRELVEFVVERAEQALGVSGPRTVRWTGKSP